MLALYLRLMWTKYVKKKRVFNSKLYTTIEKYVNKKYKNMEKTKYTIYTAAYQ